MNDQGLGPGDHGSVLPLNGTNRPGTFVKGKGASLSPLSGVIQPRTRGASNATALSSSQKKGEEHRQWLVTKITQIDFSVEAQRVSKKGHKGALVRAHVVNLQF